MSGPESTELRQARNTWSAKLLVPVQAILAGCAVLMSLWTGISTVGKVGVTLLEASALAASLVRAPNPRWLLRSSIAAAWACTLIVPATLLLFSDQKFRFEPYLDQYYAVLAWLIAVTLLCASYRAIDVKSRQKWRSAGLVWACIGAIISLAAAYEQNHTGAFVASILLTVGLLLLWKTWFRLTGWATQAANTLIVVLLGVPLADVVFHPGYRVRTEPDLRQRLYSYEAGHKNPVAYATWWDAYLREVDSMEENILIPDPDHYLPYRLRPGSHAMLFQSRIEINSLGFRGREFAREKDGTYRIVALGESTTFGISINPQDRPWPELLEQIIRERLHPQRKVEVINAGVPGYTLDHNLYRFAKDILPLQPDLVLSYHGINSFHLLHRNIAPNRGPPPPRYQPRPIRLLADCEYHLKLLKYQQRVGLVKVPAALPVDPLATVYAQQYGRLIGLARTNHFRLALANFSMTVNADSDPQVIRFYQVAYPQAPLLISANALHSQIVKTLAERDPDVCFVDTHPHLDGECDNFLDLVHFTSAGDRQLAENFFAAIRRILEADLCPGDSE